MKLTIGDNIRKYRKELGMTQDQLADKLGVTYQSISRWENGSTYPDLEFLPAIAGVFSITIDKLLGMPEAEKEKKANEAFDELRRECIKWDYDADRIVAILQDIRRNYMDSEHAWRPWCEGNGRAFKDPKILPEVRLLAEAQLERDPMYVPTIQTLAAVEDDEHIDEFLNKHSPAIDCSKSALLYLRYLVQGNKERFEVERRYRLFCSIENALNDDNLLGLERKPDKLAAAQRFMMSLLQLVRCEGSDTEPDIWITSRLCLEMDLSERLAAQGETEKALEALTKWVELLENTMKITDETPLPTSCPWLEGMVWTAKEEWHTYDNNPDSPEERHIIISTRINNINLCNFVYPSAFYKSFSSAGFDSLRENQEFISIVERVKALVVTRKHQ